MPSHIDISRKYIVCLRERRSAAYVVVCGGVVGVYEGELFASFISFYFSSIRSETEQNREQEKKEEVRKSYSPRKLIKEKLFSRNVNRHRARGRDKHKSLR